MSVGYGMSISWRYFGEDGLGVNTKFCSLPMRLSFDTALPRNPCIIVWWNFNMSARGERSSWWRVGREERIWHCCAMHSTTLVASCVASIE
jgi:hypothetical protein